MIKIIIYVIVIYISLLVFLYFFQGRLTYFPSGSSVSPAAAGVPEMQVIELATRDHLTIKAWYKPPARVDIPTIVYFHGNGGDIANRAFIVKPFMDSGYGVLLLTYRGYSGNPGTPSEEGLYSDARAALRFLMDKGVSEKCIVLYGESIGSSVAIQMATEYKVGAIILQAPFTKLADVASIHYAFLVPFKWMIREKYDSLSKANRISSPALVIHGKNDTIIPPELSRKLFEALPHPKEAQYIPGSGHNDLFEPQIVSDFIHRHVHCKD